MTTYYVGPGGGDGESGASWADRKLTLNGAEDIPVAAGDTVYVGPGVYRHTLTVDVDGTSGNPITYIGDVTGENTDGVGGLVRITGSDNDQTNARAYCIQGNADDYRTFRGFMLDTCSTELIELTNCDNWILEDCAFQNGYTYSAIRAEEACMNCTIRRCVFILSFASAGRTIRWGAASAVDDVNLLVENCMFLGGGGNGQIRFQYVGSCIVKDSLFFGSAGYAIRAGLQNASQEHLVNNCVFIGSEASALQGDAAGIIIEDYNTFYGNSSDRTNVSVGSNSQTYPPIFTSPVLFDGIKYPWWFGELSEWSQINRIAGTGEATDDLFGIARPTTSAKKSWGPIQLREGERDTATVQTGNASVKLADAGDHPMFVPTDGSQITIDVSTYFETNYAGTKPQLIVRQPGASDSSDTATGAVDTWEDLSVTLTPNASPPYVVVILRSLNTAISGSYATYFDDLGVS